MYLGAECWHVNMSHEKVKMLKWRQSAVTCLRTQTPLSGPHDLTRKTNSIVAWWKRCHLQSPSTRMRAFAHVSDRKKPSFMFWVVAGERRSTSGLLHSLFRNVGEKIDLMCTNCTNDMQVSVERLKMAIYAHSSPSFQQWEIPSNAAKATRSPYKACHHHQAEEEEEGPTWRFVF